MTPQANLIAFGRRKIQFNPGIVACFSSITLITLSALASTFGGIPQHREVEVGRVGRLFIASSFNRP
jgi:hypothetical protein